MRRLIATSDAKHYSKVRHLVLTNTIVNTAQASLKQNTACTRTSVFVEGLRLTEASSNYVRLTKAA